MPLGVFNTQWDMWSVLPAAFTLKGQRQTARKKTKGFSIEENQQATYAQKMQFY